MHASPDICKPYHRTSINRCEVFIKRAPCRSNIFIDCVKVHVKLVRVSSGSSGCNRTCNDTLVRLLFARLITGNILSRLKGGVVSYRFRKTATMAIKVILGNVCDELRLTIRFHLTRTEERCYQPSFVNLI